VPDFDSRASPLCLRRLCLHFSFVLFRQSRPQQTLYFVLLAILAVHATVRLCSARLARIRFQSGRLFHADECELCDALLIFHSAGADPSALAAPSHGSAIADLNAAANSGRFLRTRTWISMCRSRRNRSFSRFETRGLYST
jgi:hypothetical protein